HCDPSEPSWHMPLTQMWVAQSKGERHGPPEELLDALDDDALDVLDALDDVIPLAEAAVTPEEPVLNAPEPPPCPVPLEPLVMPPAPLAAPVALWNNPSVSTEHAAQVATAAERRSKEARER